jgi:hypothetical protein
MTADAQTLSLPATSIGTAKFLSYLGIVPFAASALIAWYGPESWFAYAIKNMAVYGSMILCFIGAMHWSWVLSDRDKESGSVWLVLGIVPMTIGWIAALCPIRFAIPVILFGIVFAWTADQWAGRFHRFPTWYLKMRHHLTISVGVLLLSVCPLLD